MTLAGEFASATIPADRLEEKVRSFFGRAFDEDPEGLRLRRAGRGGLRST